MTQDEILALAQEAGYSANVPTVRLAFSGFDLYRFAELVLASRKPLTDEQINRITDQQWAVNNHKPIYAAHRAYARAIEAAHGIKEQTASAAAELPVGFVPLQKENGRLVYAACMNPKASHYKWLMWRHPDGQWVSKRKLLDWEVMQVEDQEHYGIVQEGGAL